MRVRAVVVGPGCTGPARNVEVIQEKVENGVTREGHAVRTCQVKSASSELFSLSSLIVCATSLCNS